VLPTDLQTSAIRIGIVGRDDGGVVEPGASEERCAQLSDALLALKDPETGRRLVDHVLDVRALHGPRVADEFADLLVEWSQDGPITAATSDAIGVVRGEPPCARSGNHRTHGWAVLPGARPETAFAADPLQASDFAHLLGSLLGEAGAGARRS
jgi:hypothetical protein